ncbi:hypothetical protein FXO37_10536 [Capsicum annuum]|nr:hypothetical protein FXO37_10536 [Capsicum annuum]
MQDAENRRQRLELARWIAHYFLDLGEANPWIEGQGVIKKVALNYSAKFWWMVVRYVLYSTSADNLLTWDGVALIASLMASYDIDFVSILRYEIHERDFSEMTTLPFPCLV